MAENSIFTCICIKRYTYIRQLVNLARVVKKVRIQPFEECSSLRAPWYCNKRFSLSLSDAATATVTPHNSIFTQSSAVYGDCGDLMRSITYHISAISKLMGHFSLTVKRDISVLTFGFQNVVPYLASQCDVLCMGVILKECND